MTRKHNKLNRHEILEETSEDKEELLSPAVETISYEKRKETCAKEREMQEVDRMLIEVLEKYLDGVVEELSDKINGLKISTSILVIEKQHNKEEIAIN